MLTRRPSVRYKCGFICYYTFRDTRIRKPRYPCLGRILRIRLYYNRQYRPRYYIPFLAPRSIPRGLRGLSIVSYILAYKNTYINPSDTNPSIPN